jgi:hypothetical protein
MVRIAVALSVLVAVVWFFLIRSVDGGPTAITLTQGFLTLYALAAIVLVWLGVGFLRIIRASLKARREVFGDSATDNHTPASN